MPLWFWNVTALVKDKLWVQVGVAAVGWRPHCFSSVLSIDGGRRACDFGGFWPSDSLFLLGRDPRMELLMWIASQGDWIPIKRPGPPFPSETQPLLGWLWAWASIKPRPACAEEFRARKQGWGVGTGSGRWSWGDWRWKLKGTFDGTWLFFSHHL